MKMENHHDTADAFHKIIQVSITVHIVGNRNQFPQGARAAHPKAVGYAYPSEIWVLGYRLSNGKIRMYNELLGHELAHILNWLDPEVENPDIKRTFVILR
jgi:hypothetical protein